MKKTEIESFLQEFLPGYSMESVHFTPLPKRAMKFYLIRACVSILVLGIVATYFYPQFSWLAVIVLLVTFLLGFMRYQDGGFSVEPERVIIRFRGFSRKTMLLYHKRIQAFEKKQHPFQKREGLATMKLSILGKNGTGKHYRLKELEEEHVDKLGDWYSYRE
ncbi:PH domain-containing protein [Oceanobacillus profundus]